MIFLNIVLIYLMERKGMIKIKALNARNGEAILLSFIDEKINILIDGGYADTYQELCDELMILKNRGEKIDLLIVSHIDRDHIGGIIKLLEQNGAYTESKVIPISEIWFNCYLNSDSIEEKIELPSDLQKKIEQYYNNFYLYNMDAQCDVGIIQAKSLTELIVDGEYPMNLCTKGKSINTDRIKEFFKGTNIRFRFLSPTKNELDQLNEKWSNEISQINEEYINKYNLTIARAFESMFINEEIQCEDNEWINEDISSLGLDLEEIAGKNDTLKNTAANASSLAFLIEYKGKRLMFLGDSSVEVYYPKLKEIFQNKKISIDFTKISHHGSKNNISKDFLKNLECETFLICTDGSGKNQHPDKESIAKIIVHVGNQKLIYLNTQNCAIKNKSFFEELKKRDFQEKYHYQIKFSNEIILKRVDE